MARSLALTESQAEVIRPAGQLAVEPTHDFIGFQQGMASVGLLAEGRHYPLLCSTALPTKKPTS